jgi:hypothetical protein
MKAQTLSYIFLNFSILSFIFLNIHLDRAFGSNCRILFLQCSIWTFLWTFIHITQILMWKSSLFFFYINLVLLYNYLQWPDQKLTSINATLLRALWLNNNLINLHVGKLLNWFIIWTKKFTIGARISWH